jgi:hypothetical protein
MINRRFALLALAALAVGGTACASGRAANPVYRADIGTATLGDAVSLAEQVINRHGFEVEQMQTEPDIRIVTHWKARQVLRDEAALGVTGAENRVIVTGRLRGMQELGATFTVNMMVENRVQVARSTDWNESLNTDMFKEYADRIANDYRQLVSNIGVRRF